MDNQKLSYDLAMLCTERYLRELSFTSGTDLVSKATDAFRTFYIELKHSPDIESLVGVIKDTD